MSEFTIVTGLFDIGRGGPVEKLDRNHVRPFDRYLEAFEVLLRLDAPMAVYVEPDVVPFVTRRRASSNTRVLERTLDSFRTDFDFFDQVQQIRRRPEWRDRAAWLAGSPQANLAYYNPIVMSKMGMLHDVSIINPFNTQSFLWLDAGLAFTCRAALEQPGWLKRIGSLLQGFLFLCYPYEEQGEVHGFDAEYMARLARTDRIRRVVRGGLFGGAGAAIARANHAYYSFLGASFAKGEMGTEENIFTIMDYREPQKYDRFMLSSNGLIAPFLESLEGGPVPVVSTRAVDVLQPSTEPPLVKTTHVAREPESLSTALYVLGFNSPEQFALLIERWSQQPGFLTDTTRYLVDNSVDLSTTEAYLGLCRQHGFTHIKRDNLGICGGRQFVAQHFDDGQHDYMLFLEDDMLLHGPDAGLCKNGFPTWIDGLYLKLLRIMEKERFDFLKLSFTEFFGNNSDQWSWYNVPASVRRGLWPEMPTLPETGFAERIPATRFERIGVEEGVPYATGEVYYANWPHIVGREGNQRMFLDTVWAHPYEQTWMSHMFQLSRAGRLRPAVLLASVIEHRRVHHYPQETRRES